MKWVPVIVIIALAYYAGAKYPQLLSKVGL